MKQLLLALLVSFSLFVGPLATTSLVKTVYAEEPIELNFGDLAKDKNVIGTAKYESDDGEAGFGALIGQILSIVLTLAAIIVFIMLIWGGLEWITAGGDKGKIEKARNRITQSIIGMFVLAAVVAIFMMLQTLLKFEILEFSNKAAPAPPTNPRDPGDQGRPRPIPT